MIEKINCGPPHLAIPNIVAYLHDVAVLYSVNRRLSVISGIVHGVFHAALVDPDGDPRGAFYIHEHWTI